MSTFIKIDPTKIQLSELKSFLKRLARKYNLDLLKETRKKYAAIYTNGEEGGIPDDYYDVLVDTIRELDPAFKVPVGAPPPADSKKADLPFYMGSANKIYLIILANYQNGLHKIHLQHM